MFKEFRHRIGIVFPSSDIGTCSKCGEIVNIDLGDKDREEKFMKEFNFHIGEFGDKLAKQRFFGNVRSNFWHILVVLCMYSLFDYLTFKNENSTFMFFTIAYGGIYIVFSCTYFFLNRFLKKKRLKDEIEYLTKVEEMT